ncbi:hypothetical protein [Halorubellus sp. PRR65]|uniref:hypothetical protein n=1 Tax=Halorubellus sp. PRR65 TaxID=3098148 RepID=UPI002B261CF1|nr:hypothetical protein [Halorubellus sp. PRR65]
MAVVCVDVDVESTVVAGGVDGAGEIESGDTLGLEETSQSVFWSGETVRVLWNNGQKSQVLGSGTLN